MGRPSQPGRGRRRRRQLRLRPHHRPTRPASPPSPPAPWQGPAATTTLAYSTATGLADAKTYNDGSATPGLQRQAATATTTSGPGDERRLPGLQQAPATSTPPATPRDQRHAITDAVRSAGRPGPAAGDHRDRRGPDHPGSPPDQHQHPATTPQGQLEATAPAPAGPHRLRLLAGGRPRPRRLGWALKSVKLVAGGVTLAETDYGYDPSTKRLATVTVKGQNGAPDRIFTYAYQPSTDLVHSITAPGSTTTLGYDPANRPADAASGPSPPPTARSTAPASPTTTTTSGRPRR